MSLCTIALENCVVRPSIDDIEFEVGTEGILKDIWEGIKKFFKALWEWIKGVWYKILSFFGIKKKNVESDVKETKELIEKIEKVDSQIVKDVIQVSDKAESSKQTSENDVKLLGYDDTKYPLAIVEPKKIKTVKEILEENGSYSDYVYKNMIKEHNEKNKSTGNSLAAFVNFGNIIDLYNNFYIEAKDIYDGCTKLYKEILFTDIEKFYLDGKDARDVFAEYFQDLDMFKYTKTKSKEDIKYLSYQEIENKGRLFPFPDSFVHIGSNLDYKKVAILYKNSNICTKFEEVKHLYRSNIQAMNSFINNTNRIEISLKEQNKQFTSPVYDRFLIKIGKILKDDGTNKAAQRNGYSKVYLEEHSELKYYDALAHKLSKFYGVLVSNAVSAMNQLGNVYKVIVDNIEKLKYVVSEVYKNTRAVKFYDRTYR